MSASLYLCYQSLLDPLTQTQVVAYLEGLALAGHRIVFLTFEPRRLSSQEVENWRQCMSAKGINWSWCRYHKRPTVPATIWDVCTGIAVGWRMMRRHQLHLIHARGYVPGLIGAVLKRLMGAKLLLDIRGFMAEEYVDAGVWPRDGRLFRVTKRVERTLVKSADGIVVLTEAARTLLEAWYPKETANKPVEVIPCCVDVHSDGNPDENVFREAPIDTCGPTDSLQRSPVSVSFVYVGKLGGWYPTEEMAKFFRIARQHLPNSQWQIWTQTDHEQVRNMMDACGLNGEVSIGKAGPDELPSRLANSHAAIAFYRRNLSAAACSPTKIGEYLAAGLPVVASARIGDVDALLAGGNDGPVGVVVREFSDQACHQAVRRLIELLAERNIRQRCRQVAQQQLSLQTVGWERYRRMYKTLDARCATQHLSTDRLEILQRCGSRTSLETSTVNKTGTL